MAASASTKPGIVTAAFSPSRSTCDRRTDSSGPVPASVRVAPGCERWSAVKPSTRAGSRFSGASRASDRIRSPGARGGRGARTSTPLGTTVTGTRGCHFSAIASAVARLTAIAAWKRRSRAVCAAAMTRVLADERW
jgi:hypothetical protein